MSDGNEIHVDDDWKNRAEAEKQAANKKQAEPADDRDGIPEASFPLLVSTLATQAIAALGQMPDPNTGQATVYKPLARHMIDLLAVLEDKTKGNLEEDESAMLTEILAQLRMVYLQTPDRPMPGDSESESSIVLP